MEKNAALSHAFNIQEFAQKYDMVKFCVLNQRLFFRLFSFFFLFFAFLKHREDVKSVIRVHQPIIEFEIQVIKLTMFMCIARNEDRVCFNCGLSVR